MTTIKREKTLLVLVHGFMSDRHCWDTLCRLFESDPNVHSRFEIECFEYPTSLFGTGDEAARPRLKDIAGRLLERLSSDRFTDRELVLVGHSQGGLVIQAFFVLLLESKQARQLRRIRQAIFIATPNLGSIFLDRARRVTDRILKYFTRAFLNPQERLLRALQPEIMDIQKVLIDRVVATATGSDEAWPIPLQCFYGTRDSIVLAVSAQSFFSRDVCTALDAGHMDIVEPRDALDERYVQLVDALLNPIGHANVFEIARYETHLRVEPCSGQEGLSVQHGTQARKVFTNNRAFLTRTITVSSKNRMQGAYVIPYLTNSDGFIRPLPPELIDSLVTKDRTRYEMYGREFNFTFVPDPGRTYGVTIEILRGFEQGDRRIHFHLGSATYYQLLVYTLDLTAYGRAGYRITRVPRLLLEDAKDHRCEDIWESPSFEATSWMEEGVWTWEIPQVRGGAIGLVWDLDH